MHRRSNAVGFHHSLLALWFGAGETAAQPAVTASDVERLHDALFEAGTVIARLRTGDATLRKELRAEMADIRGDTTALGARLRAREAVGWDAYVQLRRRIEEVSRRARSRITVTGAGRGPTARAPYPADETPPPLEVPEGVELEARLLVAVNPLTARDGERVEAVTTAEYAAGGTVIIPAGSLLRGVVAVRQPENGSRGGAPRIAVRFEDVLVRFTTHPIEVAATEAISGPLRVGALLRIRFD